MAQQARQKRLLFSPGTALASIVGAPLALSFSAPRGANLLILLENLKSPQWSMNATG
jgi:hypothetical protein